MQEFGKPEKVYVELDWYDGPVSGIGDINGVPHRFKLLFDEVKDEYSEIYLASPLEEKFLELEKKQWRVFVAWNELYEKGIETTDTHPGHGGIHTRWDELEFLLKESRNSTSKISIKAKAKIINIDRERRYEEEGPDYKMCWCIL